MSANPTPSPLWRCKTCDHQFGEPEIWPPADHQARRIIQADLQKTDWLKVCPRCHSSAIEQWR